MSYAKPKDIVENMLNAEAKTIGFGKFGFDGTIFPMVNAKPDTSL